MGDWRYGTRPHPTRRYVHTTMSRRSWLHREKHKGPARPAPDPSNSTYSAEASAMDPERDPSERKLVLVWGESTDSHDWTKHDQAKLRSSRRGRSLLSANDIFIQEARS